MTRSDPFSINERMSTSSENQNIKVLMYHRITQNTHGSWHAVKEDNFRQQLQLIDKLNFTPITFLDYQLYLDEKLSLPKKPIILTFDDGHLDTFEIAMPILREFGMRAVIYPIGNRNLRYAIWDQKHESDKCPLMTNEQILLAREEGFEIGAHSLTHPKFSNLCKEELQEEILGSKMSLENLLGEKVLSFAYPYGLVDQRAHSIVQNSGYKFACGVYTGPPQFGTDIFDIRRLAIGNKVGVAGFLLRLLTPYEYLEWMYHKLRNKSSEKSGYAGEVNIPNVDYEKTFSNNPEPK